VDYLIAFNNDLLACGSVQINLAKGFTAGRGLYDLDTLQRVSARELTGAVTFPVEVAPGGGRVFTLASESDYQWQRNVILRERCKNRAAVMESDYALAAKSGIALNDVSPWRAKFRERLAAEDYEEAWSAVAQCATCLDDAMRRWSYFAAVRQDLESIRGHLGQLEVRRQLSHDRLRAEYLRLLGQFLDGKARSIRRETRLLLQQAETTTRVAERADAPEKLSPGP